MEIKGESCGTNFRKDTLPKESIETQNVTNAPHLISQSKPPALDEIMVEKLQSDLSVLSGAKRSTRAIIIPEKTFQERKVILNHLQRCHQERIKFQIRIIVLY